MNELRKHLPHRLQLFPWSTFAPAFSPTRSEKRKQQTHWQQNYTQQLSSSPKNYYDSLGLTPKATQQEVKDSYFKLSKLYHPDVNQNDENSVNKFREVSEAYEVLGNPRSREDYDRNLGGGKFSKWSSGRPERSPQTGRSDVYDYDEWMRGHYKDLFDRRSKEIRYKEYKTEMKKRHEDNNLIVRKWITVIGVSLLLITLVDLEIKSLDRSTVARKDKR